MSFAWSDFLWGLWGLRRWALPLVAVVLLWAWHTAAEREGALRQRIQAREAVIASLARQKARVDTAYTRDTVTLTRWRTTYTGIRDTLRLTDTVAVKRFVLTADSTIHACSVALETCEHRVAWRDSLLIQKDSLITDLKRRKPFLLRIGKPLVPFVVGVVAGTLLRR